ncbi:hypothetical protein JCM11251_006938 [Rhodosporidiobolus azoricus]
MTDGRPSDHEAGLALFHLLAAVHQQNQQSSPAAPGTSPAASVSATGGYTPASSAAAPTPHAHPALEFTSEASTYELMRSLGALGGPPPSVLSQPVAPIGVVTAPSPVTSTSTRTSATRSASSSSASGAVASTSTSAGTFLAPPPSATTSSSSVPRSSRRQSRASSAASSAPAPASAASSSTTSSTFSYQPQPTRSGRMPVVPTADAELDPATVLFNDYFDFPSSDEEDDPDFDPSILGPEHENDDGDDGPDEDGIDWSWWGVDNAGDEGAGGAGAAVGSGESRVGLTSDEFAAELALLTGVIDTPEGAVGVSPAQQQQDLNVSLSPRRDGRVRRSIAADSNSSEGANKEQQRPAQPEGRKKRGTTASQQEQQPPAARKRPRRGERLALSPVLEDEDVLPDISVLQPHPRASTSTSASQQHQQPLVRPIPSVFDLPIPSHPSSSSSSVMHIPAPPSEDPPSPASGAAADEPPLKKKRNRKAIYTPEEAVARRKAQEALRQQERRKKEKEKKMEAEMVKEENGKLREENEQLRERVKGLERELEELRRRTARGGRVRPEKRREDGDETSSASEEEDDESDGGEYQVQSSEESSDEDDLGADGTPGAGDGFGFDANWGASAVAAELEQLAAARTEPLPPQLQLDLAGLDAGGLAELMEVVKEAARAQGVQIA